MCRQCRGRCEARNDHRRDGGTESANRRSNKEREVCSLPAVEQALVAALYK